MGEFDSLLDVSVLLGEADGLVTFFVCILHMFEPQLVPPLVHIALGLIFEMVCVLPFLIVQDLPLSFIQLVPWKVLESVEELLVQARFCATLTVVLILRSVLE